MSAFGQKRTLAQWLKTPKEGSWKFCRYGCSHTK